jgi:hypothetical protein
MNNLLQRDHFQLIKTTAQPPVLEASPDHLRNNLIGLWNQVKELRSLIATAPKGGRFVQGSLSQAWMNEILIQMVKRGVPIISLTPGAEIVTVNNSAVKLGYTSIDQLMVAINAAVQGQATKAIGGAGNNTLETFAKGITGASMAENVSGTQFDSLTGTYVFGWRIRVTASELNFARRPIVIDIGNMTSDATATTISSPVFTALVYPTSKAPIDIVVLSVSNASGLFTVVPGDCGNGIGANNTTGTGRNSVALRAYTSDTVHFANVESLNARDLLKRFGYGDASNDDHLAESYNRDELVPESANRD